MDSAGDDPFLLFLSPHPPHYTPFKFAPDHCYERLPKTLTLPANVPDHLLSASLDMYRHYLAMILAVDDMLGRLLDYLEQNKLVDNTIVLFASDHGTQGGGQGVNPWSKKNPYENSIRIPALLRYPGVIEPGVSQRMTSMVDYFPTLCGLVGIPVPRSIEGTDLSTQWRNTSEDHSAFIMNFSKWFDWFQDGAEWRGVRTQQYTYAEWLSGKKELYDLAEDPLQMHNLAGQAGALETRLQDMLRNHQRQREDELVPCSDWKHWLDEQRRVVRNAHGPLSHPESTPDWSLLR